MRKHLVVSGLVLVLMMLICQPLLAADDLSELKEKIEATSNKIVKAVLAGDVEAEHTYYTDDYVSMPNYEPMTRGKEASKRSALEAKEAGYKFHSMDFTTLDVWTCGDLVYEIGTYGISLTIPGMGMPVADNGKYLTVWEKGQDGSLKIKIEIWNTDVNPMDWSKGEHEEKR